VLTQYSKAILFSIGLIASVVFIACGDDDSSGTRNILDDVWVLSSESDDDNSSSSLAGSSDTDEDKSSSSTEANSSAKDTQSSSAAESSGSSSAADSASSSSVADSASSSSMQSSSSSKIERPEFTEVSGIFIRKDTVSGGYPKHVYKTVQIGNKIWLAENVQSEANSSMTKCYNDSASYCTTMGRLYRTDAVGCPDDFKIPTQADWENLFAIVKDMKSLRAKDSWDTDEKNAGTDDYGFGLLASGSCDLDTCTGMHKETRLWTSDPYGHYLITANSSTPVFNKGYNMSRYVAARCVKDAMDLYSIQDLPEKCSYKDRRSIRDSLYYECYDGEWRQSTDSSPKECSEKQEGLTVVYYGTEYNCRSTKWKSVSNVDKELGYCTKAKQGDTATYKSTLYVCDTLSWRTTVISDVYGACVQVERDSIVKFNGKQYVCLDSNWRLANSNEIKYGVCTNDLAGIFADEEVALVCKKHSWTTPTKLDYLGVCNAKETGTIREYSNSTYICKDSVWVVASVLESHYGLCTAALEGTIMDSMFICKSSAWDVATVYELLGTCQKSNAYEMKEFKDSHYICKDGSWKSPTSYEIKYGACYSATEGTVKDNYVCKNGKWTEAGVDELLGQCNSKRDKELGKYDGRTYICKNDTWTLATAVEIAGYCTTDKENLIVDDTYVCQSQKWRKMYDSESDVGKFCTKANAGDTATYKYSSAYRYGCNGTNWKKISDISYHMGLCNSDSTDVYKVYNDSIYKCQSYSAEWQNSGVNAILGYCRYEDNRYVVKTYKGVTYKCTPTTSNLSNYKWITPQEDIDIALGFCHLGNVGEYKSFRDTLRICRLAHYDEPEWQIAMKYNYLYDCSDETINQTKEFYGQEYVCLDDGWAPSYGSYTDTRNNMTYRTINIYGTTWMVDNLNYPTDNSSCYYDTESNCDEYGRLYTWDDAMSACPDGWHLPKYDYALYYFSYVLTSRDNTWQTQNSNITYSDLEMKAAGWQMNGNYDYLHRIATFWYSDEYESGQAFGECINEAGSARACPSKQIVPGTEDKEMFTYAKTNKLSVRCVKETQVK